MSVSNATLYEKPKSLNLGSESAIDKVVHQKLRQKGISPSEPCSDSVFLRRVYLDAIGTLPTADESRSFLQRPDRNLLIRQLLDRPEFATYWAMKWAELLRVKSEFPINLWPMAAQEYHRWIRTQLDRNTPIDQFARSLLTSEGSNFRVGPANFYRAVTAKTPEGISEAVTLTWMGLRPGKVSRELTPVFSSVAFKPTGEWKEEIVFWNPLATAKPSEISLPDGQKMTISAEADPRIAFAAWLTSPKNPWFAKNISNRIWSWIFGSGVINPADDLNPQNASTNPALTQILTQELVRERFDTKQMMLSIFESQTYQQSSIPASPQKDAARFFAYYQIRPLGAEVLLDAIDQISGTQDGYSSAAPEPYTFIPEEHRSIELADGSITSSFLEMFGRPTRDAGYESERNQQVSVMQRLHLLNSTHIQRKLNLGPALKDLYRTAINPEQFAQRVYLTVLSRYPSADEVQKIKSYVSKQKVRQTAFQDVVWALVNSSEFLYRH